MPEAVYDVSTLALNGIRLCIQPMIRLHILTIGYKNTLPARRNEASSLASSSDRPYRFSKILLVIVSLRETFFRHWNPITYGAR